MARGLQNGIYCLKVNIHTWYSYFDGELQAWSTAASRDDMVHILSSQHFNHVGGKHILCDFKTLPRRKVLKTMEKKHEWGDFRTIVEDKGPSVLKTVSIIEEGQHWQYKHQKKWKWWWFWSMIIIISVGTTLAVKIPIIETNYLTSITSNLNYTTEKNLDWGCLI